MKTCFPGNRSVPKVPEIKGMKTTQEESFEVI
jgi:hypothetical protein